MKELAIRPRSSPERRRRFAHILRHVAMARRRPIASREDTRVIPGEYLLGEGDVIANQGRRTVELTVANTGDRPIQVGSHFHFFEANRALRFDRAQAFGMRLNVPAGTAVRLEPGEEAKFGGGKVIRDGMGQSARATRSDATLDTVITNAVIVDHWGIVKADIGIRDGRIVAIGKAGNPDLMAGVTSGMVIGAATEVIAGEGKIVTAGGLDSHIHFICPQIVAEAISAGLTTLVGRRTGPAPGTAAPTCTPGEWNIHRMLEAAEAFPINLGFVGKGTASTPEPPRDQIAAG